MIEISSDQDITVGVVADSHVPDRATRLHPDLLKGLQERKVILILHAGDLSHPLVLDELEKVAPVQAVAGNRDWFFRSGLSSFAELRINGVNVILAHGHINIRHYWYDKVQNLLRGYRFERFQKRLASNYPGSRVYVFGHSHHAENRLVNEALYFNPGSCSVAEKPDYRLSFGIIRFYPDGQVAGEIIDLDPKFMS